LLILVPLGYGFAQAREQKQTQLERDKARHVANFLAGIFEATSPEFGKKVTAADLLEKAEKNLNHSLLEPEIRGSLYSHIARAYMNLGLYDKAGDHMGKGLTLLRQALPDHHPDVVESIYYQGELLHFQEAYEQAVEHLEQARKLNQESEDTDLSFRARCNWQLAQSFTSMERFDEARKHYSLAQELFGRCEPKDFMGISHVLNGRGELARAQGEPKQALGLNLKAIAVLQNVAGEDSFWSSNLHNSVGLAYLELGTYEKAEKAFLEAIRISRLSVQDGAHIGTMLNNQAEALIKLGRFKDALAPARECFDFTEMAYGPDHIRLSYSLNNLGKINFELGRLTEAEKHYRQALILRSRTFGPRSRWVAISNTNLADCLIRMKQFEEAEQLGVEALRIKRELLGEGHYSNGFTLVVLSRLHAAQGDGETAKDLAKQALEIYLEKLGDQHPLVLKTRAMLN